MQLRRQTATSADRVKTSKEQELVWSEAYLSSLRRFAQLLHLPLLVARRRGGLWTLTDTEHFEKRCSAYHLSSETALSENLMGMMFGDTMVVLQQDFQLVIEVTVAEQLPPEGLIPEGYYTFTIREAGFHVAGKKVDNLPREQVWLFMACSTENRAERTGENAARIIHYPAPESGFPIFDVLLAQIAWNKPHRQESEINWNEEITRGPFPSSGARFRDAIEEGFKLGTTLYGLTQEPHTVPPFLRDPKTASGV